jgi:hypothetical protein
MLLAVLFKSIDFIILVFNLLTELKSVIGLTGFPVFFEA